MSARVALLVAVAAALLAGAPPAAAVAAPACWGAADRDPERPCHNPRLRLRVEPTPDRAVLTPNVACVRQDPGSVVARCAFGAAEGTARETVAVLGDSHAAHWRGALAVVARARRWRVVEMATPHCPLTAAVPMSGGEPVRWCPDVNRAIRDWLAAHPEVRTVIVAAHTRAPVQVPAGRTELEERVAGFLTAWQALPGTVQRLVVLRDTPIDRTTTHACVRRALRQRRPAGTVCRVRRSHALVRDAAVLAAERLHARGARVVDLTPHVCGARWCHPVVGGVLVHRDVDHLTQAFARSLGPYLLRAIDRLDLPDPGPQ